MKNILSPNEKLIQKLHPSRWHFWQNYFWAGALLSFAVIFPFFGLVENLKTKLVISFLIFITSVLLIGLAEISRKVHSYYITDGGLIEAFSLISRRASSVRYFKIQNFDATQGVFERIVNIGNINFYTAGTNNERPEISFRGIKNPFGVKKEILDIKSKAEAKINNAF